MASTQKIVLMAIVLNLILGMAYSASLNQFTDVDTVQQYATSYTDSALIDQNKDGYLQSTQTQSNEIEANALDQIKSGRSVFQTFFRGIYHGTTGTIFWQQNNFMNTQMEIVMLGLITMLVWVFDALLLMEAVLFFWSKKTNG